MQRATFMIMADLTDSSPDYSWVDDPIALEHTVQDTLAAPDSVTVHSVSTHLHWYDVWDDHDGQQAYVCCSISPADLDKLQGEFKKSNRRKREEEPIEYTDRFIKWLRVHGHTIFTVERPHDTFGWSE